MPKNPAYFLLFGVGIYFFILLSSYDHVWMHPEEFKIKSYVLEHGVGLRGEDIKRGLNWPVFEGAARFTRFLSSYFEIVDTKFRAWVWHYLPPHPSLSLTWIFSLLFSPVFLFLFLRNLKIDSTVALSAVLWFMLTPGFLSTVVMLFRPAKAMTNFSIIFFLYLASNVARRENISFKAYLGLMSFMFINFFWDETALLMYPLCAIFFPRLLEHRKRLIIFLSIPFLVCVFYFYLIPHAAVWAGYPKPLSSYNFLPRFDIEPKYIFHYVRAFVVNSGLLIFDSLGLVRCAKSCSVGIKLLMALNAATIFFAANHIVRHLIKLFRGNQLSHTVRLQCGRLLIGMCLLLFLHTYLMVTTKLVFWGPFWYGTYWSVYGVIVGAYLINLTPVNKYALVASFAIIFLSLACTFNATNAIYKKYHYYPYSPTSIVGLFRGDFNRFDPARSAEFSNDEIKKNLYEFWLTAKEKESSGDFPGLIKENFWAAIEAAPGQYQTDYDFSDERTRITLKKNF